tara:strand:- start:4784 stop:5011 length:228 start_codon:yes stop_codon:yes gene_type:complete
MEKAIMKVLNSGGGLLGYLEKFTDTETESFPWEAYSLNYAPPPVGGVRTPPGRGKWLGAFDKKTEAIKKVENNAL